MEEPIRVLQVFSKMNRAGAEAMVMSIYRNIDRSKVQFDFMVHTEDKCDFDDEILSLGGHIYHVPRYRLINHFSYKKAWNLFFEKHPEYRLIHGHMFSLSAIYLKIAKKYHLVTIAHSHNTSSGTGAKALFKNIIQFPIRYIADYFFACSLPAGKWLFGDKVIRGSRFQILKNVIETEKFIYNEDIRNELREEYHLNGKYVIGHIGRFEAQKNHEFIIDLFYRIHSENTNTILMLTGRGGLQKTIEEKVNNLGLSDYVIFTGIRPDVQNLYQVMDIFLFPSNYEGLGIVAIEAQAAGLPCVVADTVPKEAFITDNMISLSLNDDMELWKSTVMKYKEGFERRNMYQKIIDSGYDVKSTSHYIEEFYGGLQR